MPKLHPIQKWRPKKGNKGVYTPNNKRQRGSCVKRRGPTCFHAKVISKKEVGVPKKGAFIHITRQGWFKQGEFQSKVFHTSKNSTKSKKFKKIKKKGKIKSKTSRFIQRLSRRVQDVSRSNQEGFFTYLKKRRGGGAHAWGGLLCFEVLMLFYFQEDQE